MSAPGEANHPLPATCCKNVSDGSVVFVACGAPAAFWYLHGDDVCSYCAKHNYQCGWRIRPDVQ